MRNIARIAAAVFAAAAIALGALGAAGPGMYHHGPPVADPAPAPLMHFHG